MARKVHILQDDSNQILAVEGSIKKLIKENENRKLLGYRQVQRLSKKARDDSKSEFEFTGKDGQKYRVSWWEI